MQQGPGAGHDSHCDDVPGGTLCSHAPGPSPTLPQERRHWLRAGRQCRMLLAGRRAVEWRKAGWGPGRAGRRAVYLNELPIASHCQCRRALGPERALLGMRARRGCRGARPSWRRALPRACSRWFLGRGGLLRPTTVTWILCCLRLCCRWLLLLLLFCRGWLSRGLLLLLICGSCLLHKRALLHYRLLLGHRRLEMCRNRSGMLAAHWHKRVYIRSDAAVEQALNALRHVARTCLLVWRVSHELQEAFTPKTRRPSGLRNPSPKA